ncbi:hypothetical protein JCM17844_07170 [Iodidimonas gelatinilytica]|uniref:DUF2793 domain-containing protein n=1 Tax=Iodidimonas gelatinilytica TaxID=1236966 RepID=A0A5A7MM97_9PROT|nr:DUF2793 domain-containing protein [Iodidimonas gelatinilytica]GEQ97080.1 hypothetical protein JCM17844_07170 [Iodidimonas gelatinilytica]
MSLSPRHAFPFILTNQSQKEVTHNEALSRIDLLLHLHIESATQTDPPENASEGAAWIVGAGALGAWAGHDNEIAQWLDGGWRFIAPVQGMRAWLADRQFDAIYTGTLWRSGNVWADSYSIWGQQVVGPRQGPVPDPVGGAVVDQEARDSLSALLATLRNHGLIAT